MVLVAPTSLVSPLVHPTVPPLFFHVLPPVASFFFPSSILSDPCFSFFFLPLFHPSCCLFLGLPFFIPYRGRPGGLSGPDSPWSFFPCYFFPSLVGLMSTVGAKEKLRPLPRLQTLFFECTSYRGFILELLFRETRQEHKTSKLCNAANTTINIVLFEHFKASSTKDCTIHWFQRYLLHLIETSHMLPHPHAASNSSFCTTVQSFSFFDPDCDRSDKQGHERVKKSSSLTVSLSVPFQSLPSQLCLDHGLHGRSSAAQTLAFVRNLKPLKRHNNATDDDDDNCFPEKTVVGTLWAGLEAVASSRNKLLQRERESAVLQRQV